MPRLISLDLGAHSVKVATWRLPASGWSPQSPSRGQPELDELYSQLVPQDGAMPSVASRLAALDALLDDHPSARPAAGDTTLLAWPANEASFHRLSLPFSDPAQIERTLPFTLETEVPFDLDEMVVAWRVTGASAGKTDVITALARRDRVREWLNGLAERGFDPLSVHIDAELYGPWGAMGTVVLADEAAPPSPLVAVLDVGHVHSTVSVVRDGSVVMARSVNLGGFAVTKALQAALASPEADAAPVGWADAETRKHGLSAGGAPLPPAANQRVDGVIAQFLADVRATLIKAEDELGGEVAEVRLVGGGARLHPLRMRLASDLGVPVTNALDPRDAAPGDLYGVARALGEASGSSGVVDLRVGEFAFRGHIDWVRASLGYGVVGAAFFAVASLLMFGFSYRQMMVQQSETEQAIRDTVTRSFPEVKEDQISSVTMAESLMAEMTQEAVQRASVLGDGSAQVPPTIDVLHALTQAFPPHPGVKVELSELTISPSSITFNAETDGFAGSAAVEESLKASERFSRAVKGEEQKLANGHIRFPVTIPRGDAADDAATSGEEG